ncbi:unnamed protein product, partial [Musa acuminata subsp. burmannicoides]
WLTTSFVTLSFPSPPPLPPPQSLWWRGTYSAAWRSKTTICLVWMSVSPSAHQLQWKKKCSACGETKTPLWRNGPDGPKLDDFWRTNERDDMGL